MFGVDLAAAEVASPLSGRLEDLLSMLAQTVRHACCRAAAAGASTPGPDRNGRAAIPGVGRLIGKSPCAAARALAEEVAAEEVVEQAAAPAEEGLQLRTRPLLPRQTPVIDVTELHGLALAVADHLRSNGRRPDTTDVTQSVCHGMPPCWLSRAPDGRSVISADARRSTLLQRDSWRVAVARAYTHTGRFLRKGTWLRTKRAGRPPSAHQGERLHRQHARDIDLDSCVSQSRTKRPADALTKLHVPIGLVPGASATLTRKNRPRARTTS